MLAAGGFNHFIHPCPVRQRSDYLQYILMLRINDLCSTEPSGCFKAFLDNIDHGNIRCPEGFAGQQSYKTDASCPQDHNTVAQFDAALRCCM
ncbi:hypothetical protein D3C76_1284450 [compost metagenome]